MSAASELGGDEPFTITPYAAAVSGQDGQHISYTDLPAEEHAKSPCRR